MNQSVGRSFEEEEKEAEDGENRSLPDLTLAALFFECYSVQNHFKTMVRPLKRLN